MKIIKLTTNNHKKIIKETLAVLKSGGLVVFPSDTVYGLLADSTNPKAIEKVLSFKDRPVGKAISVFVADKKMAEDYVALNQNALNVVNNLLPGPFTVICQSRHKTDSRLEAENGTLGIRLPDFPLITKLVTSFKKPITATSANIPGRPAVHSISALLNTLSKKKKSLLALIVDSNNLPKNRPSTVLDTTTGQLKTLRFGDLFPKTANSFISKSKTQTQKIARYLATNIIKKISGRPIVFLLEGNLGAGKTIFAKGLGKALYVEEEVISPTYTISYEYKIKKPTNSNQTISSHKNFSTAFDINDNSQNITINNNGLKKFVHYDLYRIESAEELKEIRLLDEIYCGNIYAIEWPERLSAEIISALKKRAEIVYIRIKTLNENQREIFWS